MSRAHTRIGPEAFTTRTLALESSPEGQAARDVSVRMPLWLRRGSAKAPWGSLRFAQHLEEIRRGAACGWCRGPSMRLLLCLLVLLRAEARPLKPCEKEA